MSIEITRVAYRRLLTFGYYENESIEAEAIVDIGGDPAEVLNELKGWVNCRLAISEEDRGSRYLIAEQVRSLKASAVSAQAELDQLKARRDKAVEFLKKHGVNTEELEEIPF